MKTKRNVLKLGFLLLIAALIFSFILVIGAESLTHAVNNLLYAAKSDAPLRAIRDYSDNIIELVPNTDTYTDQASFDKYLRRLDAALKHFKGYVGITNAHVPPGSIGMFYKKGAKINFTEMKTDPDLDPSRDWGTGWLGPVSDWDHDIQTDMIIMADSTLVKMRLIPELDEATFGRPYLLTDEIPALVGGKKAQYARIGEVYQAALYPKVKMGEDVTPVVVNVRVAGIANTHLALAGMVGSVPGEVGLMPAHSPEDYIVIIPVILDTDGNVLSLQPNPEQSLPAKIRIAFDQYVYDNQGYRPEGIAEVLRDFGRPNLLGYSFTVPFSNYIYSTGTYTVNIVSAVFLSLMLVITFTCLVNNLIQKYLEKAWSKIIAAASFPLLCYYLVKGLSWSKFVPLTSISALKLMKLSHLADDVWRVFWGEHYFNVLSSQFIDLAALLPIALMALFLIVYNALPNLPWFRRKKGEAA